MAPVRKLHLAQRPDMSKNGSVFGLGLEVKLNEPLERATHLGFGELVEQVGKRRACAATPAVGGHSCNAGMKPRFHCAFCDQGRNAVGADGGIGTDRVAHAAHRWKQNRT
jgi:hypothetical protein